MHTISKKYPFLRKEVISKNPAIQEDLSEEKPESDDSSDEAKIIAQEPSNEPAKPNERRTQMKFKPVLASRDSVKSKSTFERATKNTVLKRDDLRLSGFNIGN